MAKVSFAKLGIKTDSSIDTIQFGEHTIEVKKYLPIQEKIELISNVIIYSLDNNGFYNPIKIKIFTALEIVYKYTNLSITDKQKEDVGKLYDQLISSGLYEKIISKINLNDLEEIELTTKETIQSLYAYKNSVLGILDDISKNYENFKIDAESIQKLLGDPENLSLVKSILTKLG